MKIVLQSLCFYFFKVKSKGFGHVQILRTINIHIFLSKWHLNLGMGEILAKDIYFDAVSIVSFKEPRLQKVVKG